MLTLEIVEPFSQYPALVGVPGAMDSAWNTIGGGAGFSLVTGIDGTGKAIKTTMSNAIMGSHFQRAFTANTNKITLHVAFMLTELGAWTGTPPPFAIVLDENGLTQFGLGFNALGRMVMLGEGGVVVATSTTSFNVMQAYRCCLQVDMTSADATVIKMSVNEFGVFDAGFNVTVDAQDQTSQLMAAFRLPYIFANPQPQNSTYSIIIQDIILGRDECQDWGPMEVLIGPPTADVSVAWTRSAGTTNFGNVDEIPFNGDTDYNLSSTVGQQDIFDYQDPPHVPEFILSLSQLTIARKEDSATREIANVLKLAGGNHLGVNQALMETYSQVWTHWLLNPETGLQFTPAEFNAAQGGYEYRV